MNSKNFTRKMKGLLLPMVLAFVFLPVSTGFGAFSEGVPIEQDVFLVGPIQGPEDLPDAITIAIYGSQDGLLPLATQTFQRGQYSLDFDISKSDGLEAGSIARFKALFSEQLNLIGEEGEAIRPKELWSDLQVSGVSYGERARLGDEALVRLLLASDASIATYLTLVYEGDDSPITSIYRDLPLAYSTEGIPITQYFSGIPGVLGDTMVGPAALTPPYWEKLGDNIFYNNGNVGIGSNTPNRRLQVKYPSASGGLEALPTISVANTKQSTGGASDFSFASFEFSGNNGGVVGEFFADGSGFFLNGTPNVVFRSSTNSPLLLGTNKQIRMILSTAGNVGIGTTAAGPLGSYKLAVNGAIGCKELTVTSTGWADFVFQDDYRLPPLEEVEAFIAENRHLPGIPSEKEVLSSGVNVGDMSAKLLQKIEELTLYMIELKKENDELKAQVSSIQNQLPR